MRKASLANRPSHLAACRPHPQNEVGIDSGHLVMATHHCCHPSIEILFEREH